MYIDFESLLKQAQTMLKYRLPKNFNWEVSNLKENVDLTLSDDFRTAFPLYTKLMSQADIKQFTVTDNVCRFYQWIGLDGEPIVWLADIGTQNIVQKTISKDEIAILKDDIIQEHLLLLENVGGILELWNTPNDENMLTWAKNFFFSFPYCYSIDNQFVYSEDGWISESVEQNNQLSITNLICFSEEANGNLTLYDKKTKEVYLLLGDHCFEYVDILDGHPEYSFYTIKEVKTFTDYVELLAKQTLDNIKQ